MKGKRQGEVITGTMPGNWEVIKQSITDIQNIKRSKTYTHVVAGTLHTYMRDHAVVAVWLAVLLKLCNTELEHEYDGNCLALHD